VNAQQVQEHSNSCPEVGSLQSEAASYAMAPIDNPLITVNQVAMMVHSRETGQIHRQFSHFTRTSRSFWDPAQGVDQ
jgi:hypothetical protein